MSTPEQMAEAVGIVDESIRLAEEASRACFGPGSTQFRSFAGTAIARAAQSVASAKLLASTGLVGDAMSCGRTAVEIAIDVAYVAIDPEPRIARFAAYAAIFHHKMAKGVAAAGGVVPANILAELERRRDDFADNNPGGTMNWAGRTIADRAADGGRALLYRLSYTDQCNASHSGPGTLGYTLQRDEDGEDVVHFGTQQPEAHPMVLATSALLVLVGDVVNACGLDEALGWRSVGLSDRLHKLVETDVRSRR